MSNDACIKVQHEGHIARVVLHNPRRRNAVTYQMWTDLASTMQSLAEDKAVRVVVVSGTGDQAFSAGADISEFEQWRATAEKAEIYNEATHRGSRALEHFPKPTIAAIRGYCVGGGFELAMLCDIRLCNASARFAVTPGKLGLGYDLEDTVTLVSRLGASATREILFTARMYDAAEALRLGIVNNYYPDDSLDDAIAQYSAQIAANAPLTLEASKAIIAEAAKPASERDEALCDRLVRRCYDSEDFVEGRAAFAEKRPPKFQGR